MTGFAVGGGRGWTDGATTLAIAAAGVRAARMRKSPFSTSNSVRSQSATSSAIVRSRSASMTGAGAETDAGLREEAVRGG